MTKGDTRTTLHELRTLRVLTTAGEDRTKTGTQSNYLMVRRIQPGAAPRRSLMTLGEGRTVARQLHTYLRTNGRNLSPSDVRDLETLMSLLRSYYEIPEGQPVFPKQPKASTRTKRASPSKDAKNAASHPWRGAA